MEPTKYQLFVRVVSASGLKSVTGKEDLEVAEAVEEYVRYQIFL